MEHSRVDGGLWVLSKEILLQVLLLLFPYKTTYVDHRSEREQVGLVWRREKGGV